MPLRSTWVLNSSGIIVTPATLAAQTDGSQKTQLVSASGSVLGMVATESGNASPVYQTDRVDSGMASIHLENLSTGTYPLVIIDISDNVNYNHTATNYAHLHLREFDIACDINGAWELAFGFIQNVTSAGADFYIYKQWQGSKDVGNHLHDSFVTFPTGVALRSQSLTTMPTVATDFKSNVLVPSSRSFYIPDVYPDTGDVVFLLSVTGGTVLEFSAVVGYHSH